MTPPAAPVRVQVDEAVRDYLMELQERVDAGRLRPLTLKAYQTDLTALVHELEAHTDLLDVDRSAIERAQRGIEHRTLRRDAHGRNSPRSVSSTARWATAVRGFLRWAEQREMLSRELSSFVTRPLVPQQVTNTRLLPTEDALRLRDGSAFAGRHRLSRRDEAVVRLLLEAAPTAGELIAANTDDVGKATRQGWRIRLGPTGRLHARQAPITTSLATLIADYLRWDRPTTLEGNDALYVTSRGMRLHRVEISHLLNRTCEEGLLPWGFTARDLRRHAAILWYRVDGLDLGEIASRLGHSTVTAAYGYIARDDQPPTNPQKVADLVRGSSASFGNMPGTEMELPADS